MSLMTYVEELDAVTEVVQRYIEGALTGDSHVMKLAFHDEATIYGHEEEGLFGGPIQLMYDWIDQTGAAEGIRNRFTSIDIVGTCASVRLDMDDWNGQRFTDFLNLVKFDEGWKIVEQGLLPASVTSDRI